jgi:toxin FitB
MIILDTNVVSEVMRSPSTGQVKSWVEAQPAESLGTTAITVAEILDGVRRLPAGKRQTALQMRFYEFLDMGFGSNIFPFDFAAADAYASILVERRRIGRPMGPLDAMIAGIARSRGADIATRDATGFEGCGFRVINPWD